MLNQVQKIQSEMQDMLVNIRNGGSAINSPSGGNVPSVEVGEGNSRHRMFYWGGRFHSVPEGFEVPKMTLANFITCWYCGNERDEVPPLRFVKSYDLGIKNGKVLVSQWKKMMEHVRQATRKVGYVIPGANRIRIADTVNLYAVVKGIFRYKGLRVNHKQRYEELLWKTIFNNVTKNQGRFADEVQD